MFGPVPKSEKANGADLGDSELFSNLAAKVKLVDDVLIVALQSPARISDPFHTHASVSPWYKTNPETLRSDGALYPHST